MLLERSKGQNLAENAQISNSKCDMLSNFRPLCIVSKQPLFWSNVFVKVNKHPLCAKKKFKVDALTVLSIWDTGVDPK